MFKTYQAGSDLAFNVSTKNGLVRIVFEPQCHGTSVYSTRDVDEQKAIEEHHWFLDGKFWVLSEVDEKKLAAEAKKRKTSAKAKNIEDEKKIHIVEDINEAKDYLADEFGISRSKMKTVAEVMTIAKEKGVELKGLE